MVRLASIGAIAAAVVGVLSGAWDGDTTTALFYGGVAGYFVSLDERVP